MVAPEEYWLAKLRHLKVDVSTGDPAPHKPLLLLCVIEMVEQGLLTEPKMTRSAELLLRFQSYWCIVAHRRSARPDIRLPFHHLSNDGLWNPFTADGRPSPNRDITDYCIIEESLYALLFQPAFRTAARAVLVATYFPTEEQVGLCTLTGLVWDALKLQPLRLPDSILSESTKQGRDARFRITIVSGYQFTCALTGHCVMSPSGAGMVEAAHIHDFAKSRNNEADNGLALCPNAHWMFDEGLWSISDDLRVLATEVSYHESSPAGETLRMRHGKPLFFEPRSRLRPNPKHLAWHRENILLKNVASA